MAANRKTLKVTLILSFLQLHFQDIKSQINIINNQFEVKIPRADPSKSRLLGSKCDRNLTKYTEVNEWWDNFFSKEKDTPDPQSKFINYLHTKPSRDDLDKVCFFEDDDHGYLYSCHSDSEMCECMDTPVRTSSVSLTEGDNTSISCLVIRGESCVSSQRKTLDVEAAFIEYPCVPGFYCDSNGTRTCKDCENKQPHIFCPKPVPKHASRIPNVYLVVGYVQALYYYFVYFY